MPSTRNSSKRRQTLGVDAHVTRIVSSREGVSNDTSGISDNGASVDGGRTTNIRKSRKSMIPRMGSAPESENTVNFSSSSKPAATSRSSGIPAASTTRAKTANAGSRKSLDVRDSSKSSDMRNTRKARQSMGGALLPSHSTQASNGRNASSKGANGGETASKNRRVSLAPHMLGGHHVSSNSSNAHGSHAQSSGTNSRSAHFNEDPRDVKDKSYLNAAISKIITFLRSKNYEHSSTLSHSSLMKGPSGRDFNNIMTFLIRIIDPTFNRPPNPGEPSMKFEDEVALAFKTLGYPFPISKTGIVAVGAPHTWPALIAAIDWLIDLLVMIQGEMEEGLDWELEEKPEEVDYDDELDGQIHKDLGPLSSFERQRKRAYAQFDKFLRKSMELFTYSDDDKLEALDIEFLELLAEDSDCVEKYVVALNEENDEIEKQIEDLHNQASGLSEMEQEMNNLASKIEEFEGLRDAMKARYDETKEKFESLKKEKSSIEEQIQESKRKQEQMKLAIDAQELSVEDVRKMEREKVRIEQNIKKLDEEVVHIENVLKEEETLWQGRFQLLEEASERYNAKAESSGLISESGKNADGKQMKIVLRKEEASETVEKMMGNIDVSGYVMPYLEKLAHDYEKETMDKKESIVNKKGQIETAERSLESFAVQIESLDEKISSCKLETEEACKRIKADISAKQRQLELLKSKIASSKAPDGTESKLSEYTRRYEELLQEKQQKEKKNLARLAALSKEINKALEKAQEYEEHKKKKLKELEDYLLKKKEESSKWKLRKE